MARKVLGKHSCKGLSLKVIMDICPDDDAVGKWIENGHWLSYPRRGSFNVQIRSNTVR